MDIHFLETQYGSVDYRISCNLRNELLRKPLGMSLFDQDLEEERDFIHLIGKNEEQELIAYLQFKKIEEDTLKMQQVVVAELAQGKGIGRKLILFSEQFAIMSGFSSIILHARENVIGFYERLDYVREGERFLEVTIPHFKARKKLQ
ncbi:MAG TPA: GNAT family N-acetyltransferase [Verrucomicrobia bacterium]|nr:GNAT family N-acetyltransferase [Verrucomicrobiales bacterium]HIL55967.1 GNAT family N-acetyltransferase [Verrucomicrobiota bacterium]